MSPCTGAGQRDEKATAPPLPAVHPDPPALRLHRQPAEGEPETCPPPPPQGSDLCLGELVEDLLPEGCGDAPARVPYRQRQVPRFGARRDRHPPADRGELEGIAQEVIQNAAQEILIPQDGRKIGREEELEGDPLGPQRTLLFPARGLGQRYEGNRLLLDRQPALLQAGDVQQGPDEAREILDVSQGLREDRLLLRPERLHLSRDVRPDLEPDGRMEGFDNALPACITKAIYNGSEMHYHLSLSETLVWQARVPNTRADQKHFLPGESVYVRWKVDEGVVLAE